jgi:putative SOS response-associated peptidase YedK
MCGRFALKNPPSELITRFGLDECADFGPRYNIPPGTDIPVIRQSPEGKRVLHLLRWGLVPHWSKDLAIGTKLNNARGESVAEKPSFRDAFKRRRCLIPASGFYEWKVEGKIKQPYYIGLKSGEPMAMGGIWESWKAPDGTILRTACIITTQANDLMAGIHDRMPVILAPGAWGAWLGAENVSTEALRALLVTAPAEGMVAYPVGMAVNRPGAEGEELTKKIGL